eukprot:scaffold358_cov256-Pinguiococcus_pyrenoidosus.AAC.13
MARRPSEEDLGDARSNMLDWDVAVGASLGLQGQAGLLCVPRSCAPRRAQASQQQGHRVWKAQAPWYQPPEVRPQPEVRGGGAPWPQGRQHARAQLVLGEPGRHVQVLRSDRRGP